MAQTIIIILSVVISLIAIIVIWLNRKNIFNSNSQSVSDEIYEILVEILNLFEPNQKQPNKASFIQYDSIAEYYYNTQKRKTNIALIFLFVSIIFYLILVFFLNISFNINFIFTHFLIFSLFLFYRFILYYRISNRYFGNNEYELREFITFLEELKKKNKPPPNNSKMYGEKDLFDILFEKLLKNKKKAHQIIPEI